MLLGIAAAAIFVYESLSNFLPFRLRQLNPDISDLSISLIYLAPFFQRVAGHELGAYRPLVR